MVCALLQSCALRAGLEGLNQRIQKHAVEKGKKILQSVFKTAVSLGMIFIPHISLLKVGWRVGFKPAEMKLLVGAPITTTKAAITDYVNDRNPSFLVCGSRGSDV